MILIVIIALVAWVFSATRNMPGDTGGGGGGNNFLYDFLPFGKNNKDNNDNSEEPADISDYRDVSLKETESMVLTKVSTMPIAGYGVFTKERFIDVPTVIPNTENAEVSTTPVAPQTEFVPALRYVEKATGHIYQTYADRISEKKFSDTTILRIHEAIFGNSAQAVIMRYLRPDESTIATFIGKLPADVLGADSGMNKLQGTFLPENVTDLSISKDSTKMFYLYNLKDMGIGMVSTAFGENRTQVMDLAFTEWLSIWSSDDNITLTSKASGKAPGYAYTLNSNTKEFNKILGGVYGLTTQISPDGRLILYSNNQLALNIFNIETREITPLSIRTLAEKCVWTKDSTVLYCAMPSFVGEGTFPDTWYQGEISFNDQLWKVELGTTPIETFLDPKFSPAGEELDIVNLTLSEDESYLFLMNKKDAYLWELRLK